jgi:hypothetical protein
MPAIAAKACHAGTNPRGEACRQRQAGKSVAAQKYGLIEPEKYDSLMKLSAGTLDVVVASRRKNRRGRQVTGDYIKMPPTAVPPCPKLRAGQVSLSLSSV